MRAPGTGRSAVHALCTARLRLAVTLQPVLGTVHALLQNDPRVSTAGACEGEPGTYVNNACKVKLRNQLKDGLGHNTGFLRQPVFELEVVSAGISSVCYTHYLMTFERQQGETGGREGDRVSPSFYLRVLTQIIF